MSNHSGGYMLNDVLELLDEQGIFEWLGQQKTQQLVLQFLHIGDHYDCNDGEILDGIGQRVGVCYYCNEPADNINDEGLCQDCKIELYEEDDEDDDSDEDDYQSSD